MPRSRRSSQRDTIAREAARLLALGKARDMNEALRLAGETSGDDRAPRPSRLQVRRHAQAMSMQAMGEAEYRQQRRDWLALAEEIMATIEQAFPDSATLLVGRAAAEGGGHFDADPAVHIRVHTDASITDLAQALVQFGYDEPEFTTLETRGGRLSQLQWLDSGLRIVVTLCPQRRVFESRTDLVTDKPTPALTRAQLAERLK